MTNPLSTPLAMLCLVTAALSWAGNHFVARSIVGQVPPASANVLRWLVVALVIGIVAHRQIWRDRALLRRHWLALTAFGITGGGIFGTLQYIGLQYTTVVNMGVFNSVAPPLIVLASFLTFRDAIRPLQVLGIAVSLGGVLVMISRLDPQVLLAMTFNRGDIIILLNMTLFAVYSACLRLRPPVALTSFLFALALPAALINLPFAVWEHAAGNVFEANAMGIATVGYAALFTSIVAYLCWSRGVEALGPGRASVFLHTIPLFNTWMGTALLGESLQLHHGIGFALILTGVALTAAAPATRPARS